MEGRGKYVTGLVHGHNCVQVLAVSETLGSADDSETVGGQRIDRLHWDVDCHCHTA